MLSQAKDLTVTPTGTALEAALLEADEIKRLSPPFNRALRANQRGIWYASPDLLSFRPSHQDLTHPIGPLVPRAQVAPLGPLLALLTGRNPRIDVRSIGEILDIPREYLPDRETFCAGLRVFQDLYGERILPHMGLAPLLALGACLWKEKLVEKAAAAEGKPGIRDPDPDEDKKGEVSGPEPAAWDAERVVRVLRSLIRNGCHQIRRSRWLLRLAESSLSWLDREDPKLRHVVVFERGRPRFSGPIGTEEEAPVPAGSQRDFRDRQEYFDVAAYDRLRVLTTEIRRLCSEGREPELCLRPTRWIAQAHLLNMLPWV
jgi:DNA polymerase-3 subunit epsilon